MQQDLLAAVDQLGDPTFFMTNSHADTHCPYLAEYIKVHAGIKDGSISDPLAPNLTADESHRIKVENVVKFPHLVAEWFHLKTLLMIEYVGSTMGMLAYWGRYEFQMRGSSHLHYFFWCEGAPKLDFLDGWVVESMKELDFENVAMDEEKMQVLVDHLNEKSVACCGKDGGHEQARAALDYYNQRCSRWNHAWDDANNCPDSVINQHPAGTRHVEVPDGCVATELCHVCNGGGEKVIVDDRAAVINMVNRHTPHNANYCLRRDKDNIVYCRFHFPQKIYPPNEPHFRAKTASSGIQWELCLPINDPLLNIVNPEQAASQRANTDCKPLIGHFSAIQYVCKYATKLESATDTFEASMAKAFTQHHNADDGDGDGTDFKDKPATSAYSKFLIQQAGSRNWSSQEVAHVLKGIPSTISSHDFRSFSTSNWHKVKKVSADEYGELNPDLDALEPNKWQKYLGRMKVMWSMLADVDTTQQTLYGTAVQSHERCGCNPPVGRAR